MTNLGRRDRGQSLVEFALIIPVIILLLMGLFDFGRLVFYFNSVSESARNGARVAIVNQTSADICRVAAERAVGLGLPTTCQGAGVDGVNVVCVGNCGLVNSGRQRVTVRYTFRPLTPVVSSFTGPIVVQSSAEMVIESICVGSTCPKT